MDSAWFSAWFSASSSDVQGSSLSVNVGSAAGMISE